MAQRKLSEYDACRGTRAINSRTVWTDTAVSCCQVASVQLSGATQSACQQLLSSLCPLITTDREHPIPSPVSRRLRIISAGPAALDSVALSLTVGRQGSSGAHRGRHGSARRNQRGRGSVDYVALAAAAGMSGSRGSTSGTLLSNFTSRQSSAESQEAPHSLFDALLQLKVFTDWRK